MPDVDVVVETPVSTGSRVRQIQGMFDVPPQKKSKLRWKGNVPLDEKEWRVGLIVGPSGSGKSTVARHLFGDVVDAPLNWNAASVIEDFDESISITTISEICQAVGFNTIPAWLRPYAVLSNGEQFRVDLARRLAEGGNLVVVDEFTSVVDRQVAKIGSHAVQKHVRKQPGKKFVAVTCHYDVIEWLRPDWVLEPGHDPMRFEWTAGRWVRRPELNITISPVPYSAWPIFAPFHYMSADLCKSARCYGLFVEDQIAAFCGVIHRPHPKTRNLKAVSRVVTLPDYQGLGLAFVLTDTLGAALKAIGYRFRNFPAHPAYVRACDRSPKWALAKRPGRIDGASATRKGVGRPCAVFEYCGEAMDDEKQAQRLIGLPPFGTERQAYTPKRKVKARR